MHESVCQRYGRWRLEELLLQHTGLRIAPSADEGLTLCGDIRFRLQGPSHGPIEDTYAVELRVPVTFPQSLPTARETGGRIPAGFHKLEGGFLCLGAPTELRLKLQTSPTLLTFVEGFVIPYLFSYSYFIKHGTMPFGELAHGLSGIRQHFATLFGITDEDAAEEFVRLASLKKRAANKYLCPCGGGRRLGKCHHRRVNQLRNQLGRAWFHEQYVWLTGTSPAKSFPRRLPKLPLATSRKQGRGELSFTL